MQGFTLHRAAYLAQYDGYKELYEFAQRRRRSAIVTEDYDPYLNPGRKTPIEVAIKDGPTRDALRFLEEKYANVPKKPKPHADIGDWWALYDYGPEAVYGWPSDHEPDYPERRRNAKDAAEKREWKRKRKAARDAAIAAEIAARDGSAQKPGDALPIGALTVSEEEDSDDAATTPTTPAPRERRLRRLLFCSRGRARRRWACWRPPPPSSLPCVRCATRRARFWGTTCWMSA